MLWVTTAPKSRAIAQRTGINSAYRILWPLIKHGEKRIAEMTTDTNTHEIVWNLSVEIAKVYVALNKHIPYELLLVLWCIRVAYLLRK